MIKGKTTVRIDDCEYDVDVTFLMQSQGFEIVIPISTQQAFVVAEYLYAKQFGAITIVDKSGQEYTAYDCSCVRRITKIDMITIGGQYKTLIKGRDIPTNGILSFHFEGMEYFWANFLEDIDSRSSMGEKGQNIWYDNGKMGVDLQISNISEINALISSLIKIREYYEYIINKEILIDYIIYSDGEGMTLEILNDNRLISKNDCFISEVSMESPETIMQGLNQWLIQYNEYEEVIRIWRKTIYNRQVSEEDLFIWRCQSFELLCTLFEPLFSEAKRHIKNPKQELPNLTNFLVALNNKHNFINCDKSYFDEVKKVRNVYTHYNPKKHISEREWRNASHIIARAVQIAIAYVFGLDTKNADFFFLIPKGYNEDIKR